MPQVSTNEFNFNYFEELASLYSEGNEELEKLLLYCFRSNIMTTACCSGHWKKNNNSPYLAFQYNQENIKYFAVFLKQLVDYDYIVRYGKLNNNKSWFSVTSQDNKPDSASLFFNRIYQTMNTIEGDYYQSLPADLQYYIDFIRLAEKDNDLLTRRSNDFFMSYHSKSLLGYEFIINTSNKNYHRAAYNSGFSIDQKNSLLYHIESITREGLITKLKLLSGYIKQKEEIKPAGLQYCKHIYNNAPN